MNKDRKITELLGSVVAIFLLTIGPVYPHEYSLARTPPMGWNTFNCWTGDYDAQMVKDAANAVALSGLHDLGYEYINIDGGWDRGGGNWLPSADKFPDGIAPIANCVHALGLKLGIYVDSGRGQEAELARRFADWGVDFLKHDDWSTPLNHPTWTTMRDALLATERPILYSIHTGGNQGRADICNMWRTSGDISTEWQVWTQCLDTIADGGGRPGAWPDPDMLEVGNHTEDGRMGSVEEEKAHFSLWCVSSAPLIMGHDPRAMYCYVLYILGNTEAIAVNQDTTFDDQRRVLKRPNGTEVWAKTLEGAAKAVVFFNKTDKIATLSVSWDEIGLSPGAAQVRDLWEHKNLGTVIDRYETTVPARGCAFVKIVSGETPIPEPPATWAPKPETSYKITPLERSGWTITASRANAYNRDAADPNRLIDNDVSTMYLIEPSSESGHWVAVDMKSPKSFNAIVCDGDKYGADIPPYESYSMVHRWEVYTSADGSTWGEPVGTGMWGPRATTAVMRFPEQTSQYVKVMYTRTLQTNNDRGGWAAGVDEIYVANVTEKKDDGVAQIPHIFLSVRFFLCVARVRRT